MLYIINNPVEGGNQMKFLSTLAAVALFTLGATFSATPASAFEAGAQYNGVWTLTGETHGLTITSFDHDSAAIAYRDGDVELSAEANVFEDGAISFITSKGAVRTYFPDGTVIHEISDPDDCNGRSWNGNWNELSA